jgi:hypoxanthine-guanine phosphoribosyltransferase
MTHLERDNQTIGHFVDRPYPPSTPFVWNFLQPLKNPHVSGEFLPVTYDEFVEVFAFRMLYDLDRVLEKKADGDSLFIERLDTVDRTQKAQNRLVERIAGSMRATDASCVVVLHGASPSGTRLWNDNPSVRDRISFTIVSGYSGTTSEAPTIMLPIDTAILKSPLVHINDDVGDTLHTLATLLCSVEQAKFGTTDWKIVKSLHQTQGKPFEWFTSLYDQLLARMHKAGVVSSMLFYKNEPFLARLEAHMLESELDEWTRAQSSVYPVARIYGQHDWAMGTLLDTGIKWTDIVPYIQKYTSLDIEVLKRDPSLRRLLDQFEQSVFRVGATIDGMVRLVPHEEDRFFHAVAIHMATWLGRFAALGQNPLVYPY